MSTASEVVTQFAAIPDQYQDRERHPDFPRWGSARRGAQEQIIEEAGGKAHHLGGYVFPDGSFLRWGPPFDGEHVESHDSLDVLMTSTAERISAIIGYPYLLQLSIVDGDYRDRLRSLGVSFAERPIPQFRTWSDYLRELTYDSPRTGQRTYAYVMTRRYEIDGWAQDVFCFAEPIPDDAWPELVDAIALATGEVR